MSNEHNLNVMAEDVRRMKMAGCDSIAISTAELLSVLEFAQKQNAIVADVEDVINLLSEREWAEHCTKTDTGKRLEEAITELHNEAAPDEQPAPPVFGYMRIVSGQSFQIMEGPKRPPDRSGDSVGPWFAIYRQPPAVVSLAALLPPKVTKEWALKHKTSLSGYAEIYAIARNETISEALKNIEEANQ